MQVISRKVILLVTILILLFLSGILIWDLVTEGELLSTRVLRILSDVEELRNSSSSMNFFAPVVLF